VPGLPWLEVQDRRWGDLVRPTAASHLLPFALQARSWTRDVVVLTNGAVDVADEARRDFLSPGRTVSVHL
jgi:hypothetical protein